MSTTRKPDVIVREIEQTRAELAETIDAISDRLNPRRAAARSARPAVVGAAVVVAGVVAVRRRH